MTQPMPEGAPEAEQPVIVADNESANSFAEALEQAFAGFENLPADNAPSKEPDITPAAENTPEVPEGDSDEGAKNDDGFLDEFDDVKTEDWTPKAANRFIKLKAELKNHRTELETYKQKTREQEQQLLELKGLTENKDIETLQKRVEEYERDKMFTDLQSTVAFREAVTVPLQNLIEQANEIADKYDVDQDALLDALALEDSTEQEEQIAELFPDASDRDKAKIYRIMEEIEPVLKRRESLYENVQEAMREAQLVDEERKKFQAAEQAKKRIAVTRVVAERIKERVPFISEVEGLDLAQAEADAAAVDFSVLHPVDQAYNAISAKMLPTLLRSYAAMQAERDSLIKRLADFEDAEPGTGSGSSAARSGGGEELTFEQAFAQALGGGRNY